MKYKETVPLLVIVICLILGGCGVSSNHLSINEQASVNTKISKQPSLNKEENTINQNKDVIENNEDVFYGSWVVKKAIESGRVSAYDDEGIKKIIGNIVTFDVNYVSYQNQILKNPTYQIEVVSKEDFFDGSYVSFEQLGIDSDFIVKVEISSKDINQGHLLNRVGLFFIQNKDTLILYDNGVFFELNRLNK